MTSSLEERRAARERGDQRRKLALNAPITHELVERSYGARPNLNIDAERKAFFAVWALLQFEWADAMLAESDERWKNGQ